MLNISSKLNLSFRILTNSPQIRNFTLWGERGRTPFSKVNLLLIRKQGYENLITDTYRIYLQGQEKEPQFQILTLIFMSKHMKMWYLKCKQNCIIWRMWGYGSGIPVSKNVNFYPCSIVAHVWRYYLYIFIEIGSEKIFLN